MAVAGPALQEIQAVEVVQMHLLAAQKVDQVAQKVDQVARRAEVNE